MARILIADDEEMDRVFLDSVLGPAGHELFFAPEGQSALTSYRTHEIDVVIADLVMPELNGLQLIDEILRLDPAACIVAVSGTAPEHLETAEEMGALASLEKPLDPRELLELVQEALREREKRADPWG